MTLNELNTPQSDLPNDELYDAKLPVEVGDEDEDDIASIEIDDTPKKPTKQQKTKEFYVNEAEFEAALKKFYETDVISNELAEMIHKMVNGLAHRPNFINYTFRDEATGDALVNIMSALRKKKFVFGGSKPFSYFNAIAWNCWRNRIKREARRRTALAAYQEEMYGDLLGTSITQQED